MAGERILIVDDEPGIRFSIKDFLEFKGFSVSEAEDCSGAKKCFSNERPDFAVIDYLLPDGNALDLLSHFKEVDSNVPVIILTGHGSIDLAVQAIKEGADHFLTKPVELPALMTIMQRLLENQRDRRTQRAHNVMRGRDIIDPFRGESPAINKLADQARKVLPTDSPVLIQGETGSGKGVLASWLHHNGPRADEALVDLSCAGLTREFLETELFGHAKGAFTGAIAEKAGLFEVAHRGTVFLDEIGDVDSQIQPKLLKVLEEKRFRRLGEVQDRQVDVRLIAATHKDLAQLVREEKFRSDLYFRISAIPLYVPPLRDRPEDIPLLAKHLLKSLAPDLGLGNEIELSESAEKALKKYSWPGNIRELRNVLERAILLSGKTVLTQKDLMFSAPLTSNSPSDRADLTLAELERRHIETILREEGGHVERSAKRLGVPRSSLYQKVNKYGINLSEF